MTNPTLRGAHLVGSVNLPDTESVMRTSAAALGGHLSRIPDGETGERFHWIGFQPGRLEVIDGLERVGRRPAISRGIDLRGLRVTEGADPSTFEFPPLGYAEAAIDSYAIFARLREEGAIPLKTRFLVSLPTPAAVVGFSFMVAADRPRIEPVYARALFRELDQILDAIPHDDLAIQWDWALEFCLIEGSGYWGPIAPWWDDLWQGLADRAADQLGRIPADVEVGVHLCYGDIGETHFTEPTDAGNLVRVANVVAAAADCEINLGYICPCRSTATMTPTSHRWQALRCLRTQRSTSAWFIVRMAWRGHGVAPLPRPVTFHPSASPQSAASDAQNPGPPRSSLTFIGRSWIPSRPSR